MICPACRRAEGRPRQRHNVCAAAQHFVPRQRDPERHARLVAHLRDVLWHQGHVEIHTCPECNFGFSVPWIGGDAEFYALAHAGDPHYPDARWEFDETMNVLASPDFDRQLRVVEVGAGHGAFLDRVRALPRGDEHQIVAADLDLGSVARLHEKGYRALAGSLGDIAVNDHKRFDVVCVFQVLEHMADLDAVFGDLRRLLKPDGTVFLSVPNGEATDFQESTTGLWDMPPNHVGRWNPVAIKRAADTHGFKVLKVKTQPVETFKITWELAVCAVNGASYVPGTLDSRINAVKSRPVRGVLKRVLAVSRAPRLLAQRKHYRPQHCWAHLQPM